MNTKILLSIACIPLMGFAIAGFVIIDHNNKIDDNESSEVSIKSLIDNAVIVSNSDKPLHNFTIFNDESFPQPFSKPVIHLKSPVHSDMKCENEMTWFKQRYDENKIIKTICKDGSEFEGIKAFECESESIMMYYEKWNCRLNNDLVLVMPGIQAANITINQ